MRRVLIALLVALLVAIGLVVLGTQGIGPVVVTAEDQQRILLMFGDPRDEPTGPGLSLRLPLAEEVRTFDSRWLHLSSQPKELQTTDRERVVVDNYAIWRITDPLLFYESFPEGLNEAETQIDKQVKARVREVIGRHTLAELLRDEREAIMTEITEKSAVGLARFGIELRDVRINRTELPRGAEENVYARMRAERAQQARKHRAEGDEEARRIRAEADREAQVIVAEARGAAEVERGRGDAEAARIYAEAYGVDEEFYDFVRSLEAYKKTIGAGTTMVVGPDHEFFRQLQAGDRNAAP